MLLKEGLRSRRKSAKILMWAAVLALALWPVFAGSVSRSQVAPEPNRPGLLLNSGLTTEQEAQIRIVLWFSKEDLILEFWPLLPKEGWSWEKKALQTGNGEVAISLAGTTYANIEDEKSILSRYESLVEKARVIGGTVYLDERIAERIDIYAYLSALGALPQQYLSDGALTSVAGFGPGFYPGVLAGSDEINLQLLTRPGGERGHTVLALPVLLEEF